MSDQNEAQPTTTLWGNMFGLTPLLRLVQDPELGANANKLMRSVIDGQVAVGRIEAKVDFLLKALGHDPGQFGRFEPVTPLLARLSDGTGGAGAAGPAPNFRAGGATDGNDPPGADASPNGADDRTARDRGR